MRNLVLIHLESLNYMNYQINKRLFKTLYHWEKESLSFSEYYATATSTLMVLSDLAFGGIMQNEPSRRLTEKLEKYYYKNSFLDVLKEQGYQIGVFNYPIVGADIVGSNQKNFIGYTIRMEEMDSYENYMQNIDRVIQKDKPFVVWACNYISNVSYNHNMPANNFSTSFDRWKDSYIYMDRCIHELLCMIEKKGVLDSTTILFYGDHGDELYTHGKHKGLTHAIEPYADLIHTPFWIYDNRFRKGGEIAQLINTTDIREIIEQLLTLPDEKLDIENIKLPKRRFSFARNIYAAQMLKKDSFNKGYSLTDGEFLLLANSDGMQLFQIKMDPTCHHNLLDYFQLTDDELVVDRKMYQSLGYHFPAVIDKAALSQISQIFYILREHLEKKVSQLYQYAGYESFFEEIKLHKIHYDGQTESLNNIYVEQKQIPVIAEIINRLLNCMETDCLAVYGRTGSELESVYSTIKMKHIAQLEESIQYEVLYIACKDYIEFSKILPWIEQNRDRIIIIVYVRIRVDNQFEVKKEQGISFQHIEFLTQKGQVLLFGKFFENADDVVVPKEFKVLAIMHVYNEADILKKTIEYLLSQNVDIYLIDNWSDDGSYEIAKKYQQQNSEHIYLEQFPINSKNDYYDWYHQLERTEQIAMELEYDWYIHYDVDEVRISPWKNRNLRETIYYIDKLGFNAVDNTVIDFKLTRGNTENIFMRDTYFDFRHYKAGFRQRKTWKHGKSIDLKSTGGHIARIEEPKIFPLKILNRHYPLRDLEQAKKKIFMDRKPRFVKEKKELGWHGHYDDIVSDEDLFTEKTGLIMWDDSVYDNYYISLFMGCNISMDQESDPFDICVEYFLGKRVVLYGAGRYGMYCCEKLLGNAEIVAWVDKDFEYLPWAFCIKIRSVNCLSELEFDAVLIAIQDSKIWQEVKDMLISMGVPDQKIY